MNVRQTVGKGIVIFQQEAVPPMQSFGAGLKGKSGSKLACN
ncbi:hypothetical protein [Bacillus sp. REN3]|nr:hypothetical protein [Bacillus sp. REN3]